MSALNKVIAAASQQGGVALDADPAAELVAVTASLLDEMALLLAWDPDDDGDDDSSPEGDTDDDYAGKKSSGKPVKGKKSKPGADDEDEEDDEDGKGSNKKKSKSKAAAKAKQKAQMTALCAAARIALGGLAGADAEDDWVEATSAPCTSADLLALAKGDEPAEPYGSVPYADPGYRGKKRYPIDQKRIRSAIGYFSKAKNRAEYSASQVKAIWGRIRSAAKKFGIQMGGEGKTVTAASGLDEAMVALAGMPAGGDMPMHHGPFNGSHSHPHVVRSVQTTKHFHNNDSSHDTGGFMQGVSAY